MQISQVFLQWVAFIKRKGARNSSVCQSVSEQHSRLHTTTYTQLQHLDRQFNSNIFLITYAPSYPPPGGPYNKTLLDGCKNCD